jgi:hypothetical protein
MFQKLDPLLTASQQDPFLDWSTSQSQETELIILVHAPYDNVVKIL